MLCSNCGKDIPFTGRVCPYCRIDKSADKEYTTIVYAFAFAGLLLGYAFNGFLVGFMAGVLGGMLGIVFIAAASHSNKSKAPKYYTESERKLADPNAKNRIELLRSLQERGYISADKLDEIK